MKRFFYWMVLGVLAISSCSTPRVAYLQDVTPGKPNKIAQKRDIRLRPGDKISIVVNSKNPELSELFNLPIISRTIGNSNLYSGNNGISGFTVDDLGNIDYPVVGEIHIEGMTRQEVAFTIKDLLIKNDLVKDAVVTVEFMNLTISVLGEVAKPGTFNIIKDKVTLMDAISMAGDLTITGNRRNVRVQREEKGKNVVYMLDLTSGTELYNSPVYYLQQNDIVYVEPIDMRARQATVSGNTFLQPTFWLSLTSVVVTVATMLLNVMSNNSNH
ncbi:MAG: polysaccharide biosynthesis/export family protein [Bacteroidales bacterium]|nr:polysaccharide biosynthesis/export family protein [Bacteroidales bacterium]